MALEDATNFGFVPEDYDSLFKRLEECTCGNSRLDRLEELKEKAWKYDDLYDDITE